MNQPQCWLQVPLSNGTLFRAPVRFIPIGTAHHEQARTPGHQTQRDQPHGVAMCHIGEPE